MSSVAESTPERVERLERALRHYADEANWVNRLEFKAFPGYHGRAIAERALSYRVPEQEDDERRG